MMTFRELNLAIFRHQPIDHVLWQPCISNWIHTNRTQGTLPSPHVSLSDLEICDELDCSVRAYDLGLCNPCLRIEYPDDVQVVQQKTPAGRRTCIRTPVGAVTSLTRSTAVTSAVTEFPLKTVADIPVIEYLLEHQMVWWDQDLFEEHCQMLGERGAPTLFFPRINLQRLLIDYAGFETTIFLLHDAPAAMHKLLEMIDRTDDKIYEVLCRCPVEIINFGDNIAADLISPTLFERWILPYYQRRSAQFHKAGKKCHAHWDGAVKSLLPYCKDTGLDGIEALTPLPQGDVTLEEIKAGLGEEMILLDGIPATHFLPNVSYQELERFTKQLIDMFAPNLVLGISDEISPPGDIEKVRFISQIVADYPI